MQAPGDAIGSRVRSLATFSSVNGTPSDTEVDSAAVIRTPSALTRTESPNSSSMLMPGCHVMARIGLEGLGLTLASGRK